MATPLLLLPLRMIFRRDWSAVLAFVVLANATGIPPGFDPAALIVWGTTSAAPLLLVPFRFGVLTLWASSLTTIWLVAFPPTPDPSSWHFARTLLVLVPLGTIGWFGFRLSVFGAQARRVSGAARMTL